MAKLPTITRLIEEDIPQEHRSWFSKVLMPLNSFISTVLAMLNKGLNFDDNFDAFTKQIEFTESADMYPLYIKNTLKGYPKGVIKLRLEDITASGATAITDAIDVDWGISDDGKIKINNISGISSTGYKYRLTVLVF